MNNEPWTSDQVRILVEGVGAGVSISEIASRLGLDRRRVRYRYDILRSEGRIQPARKSGRGWEYVPPDHPAVLELLDQKRTYEAEFVQDAERLMRSGELPLLEYALAVRRRRGDAFAPRKLLPRVPMVVDYESSSLSASSTGSFAVWL